MQARNRINLSPLENLPEIGNDGDLAISDKLSVYIDSNWQGLANDSLSNLNDEGNNKFANKDLSNLSSTGKTKVVTLAHELDWANATLISSTSSTNEQTYTLTADGLVVLYAESAGSPGTYSATTQFMLASGITIANASWVNTYARTFYCSAWLFFAKGETAHFYITGSTKVKAHFVPFKKA